MKSEIFVVAATWVIGGGIGQLLMLPFGMASGRIWFGLVLGATAQSVIYYYRSRNPYVR
jgi:hypothetical protein